MSQSSLRFYHSFALLYSCVGLDVYNSSIGNFDSLTSFLFVALFNSSSGDILLGFCFCCSVMVKSVLSQCRNSSGSNRTIVFETTFNCSHACIKSGYELDATRFEMYCLLQIYKNLSESLLVMHVFLGYHKFSTQSVSPQNYICHAYLM